MRLSFELLQTTLEAFSGVKQDFVANLRERIGCFEPHCAVQLYDESGARLSRRRLEHNQRASRRQLSSLTVTALIVVFNETDSSAAPILAANQLAQSPAADISSALGVEIAAAAVTQPATYIESYPVAVAPPPPPPETVAAFEGVIVVAAAGGGGILVLAIVAA
eukprot:2395801-Prymnesium_polylepis.1